MNIHLIPVTIHEKETLSDLLVIYTQELVGSLKRYEFLDRYFQDSTRHAFFIKVDGDIAGFVLVNHHAIALPGSQSIAEFYIDKNYRRQGIGEKAAKKVFDLFPGKWEVRQMKKNLLGQKFWRKVIKEYTHDNFQEVILNNDNWHGPAQVFENTKP